MCSLTCNQPEGEGPLGSLRLGSGDARSQRNRSESARSGRIAWRCASAGLSARCAEFVWRRLFVCLSIVVNTIIIIIIISSIVIVIIIIV